AGTLDLQDEGIDRVLDPQQLESAPGENAAVDLGAAGIGNGTGGIEAPEDGAAGKIVGEIAKIGGKKIRRSAIERNLETGRGRARSIELHFVIAGETALAVAAGRNLHWGELRFEERPQAGVVRGGIGHNRTWPDHIGRRPP